MTGPTGPPAARPYAPINAWCTLVNREGHSRIPPAGVTSAKTGGFAGESPSFASVHLRSQALACSVLRHLAAGGALAGAPESKRGARALPRLGDGERAPAR